MRLSTLTVLAFQLNGALAKEKSVNISIETVKAEISKGTIFSYLRKHIPYFDDSIVSDNEKRELIKEWDDLANAVDEARKMDVDKNGICLLVAYLLEGIQRRF